MKKLILLPLLTLLACQSFDCKFWRLHSLPTSETGSYAIESGKTPEDVLKALSEPLKKGSRQLPEGPFWGPQEGLASVIGFGATYREWNLAVTKCLHLPRLVEREMVLGYGFGVA
jgi:hypothetical protein